ncbi:hypothetical protein [Salinibacillus xinjiangensis]|uniref:Uncharacterized protein n=1 Tax=Salinibacillus xinjiangensis TaxID=1229268 RepID=A0A6G1X9R9_9BACI|nr:hypothetical protein [Salinibacillus xinjiangensis]MRG87761.1 hypothetical protein [Salinibacillus xinjiangensis]
MRNKGWLYLGFAGCVGLIFILMASEGYTLSNSTVIGEAQLNFLGIKIAEGATTEEWNQI